MSRFCQIPRHIKAAPIQRVERSLHFPKFAGCTGIDPSWLGISPKMQPAWCFVWRWRQFMTQLDTFRRLNFIILLTLTQFQLFLIHEGHSLYRSSRPSPPKAAAPKWGRSTKCCLTRERKIIKTIFKAQKHLEKAHGRTCSMAHVPKRPE